MLICIWKGRPKHLPSKYQIANSDCDSVTSYQFLVGLLCIKKPQIFAVAAGPIRIIGPLWTQTSFVHVALSVFR